jgi:aminopeptidase N
MSTYLLAFVITQVDYIEYVNECNVPLRLYSPSCNNPNNTKLLKFASDALRFYSQYTGMSYTFPKIGNVADLKTCLFLSVRFADLVEYDRNHSAATENWGLITFCTGLLCSNDEMYDDSQRYKVLAHEVAHFWFGNLVTNDWWDDIWLQEGFATFMGLKAERHIFKNSDVIRPLFYNKYFSQLCVLDVIVFVAIRRGCLLVGVQSQLHSHCEL